MIEIYIYLFVSVILGSLRRIISGIKNGAFYGKQKRNHDPRIEPYIKNLHRAETPAWYSQFGSLFFLLMAVFRTMGGELLPVIIMSFIITMSTSGVATYFYQGYINIGSGLPWVDPNENKKSEFAFRLFGKNYSIWWPRPWYGKRRLWFSILSAIVLILSLAISYTIF